METTRKEMMANMTDLAQHLSSTQNVKNASRKNG